MNNAHTINILKAYHKGTKKQKTYEVFHAALGSNRGCGLVKHGNENYLSFLCFT